MTKPDGFRLYIKRDLFSVMLMFPLRDTLITTTLFSVLWKGQAVVGLEVQAIDLEIGQNAQSVVLLVRTPKGPRKFLSVPKEIVVGITDVDDQEVIPVMLPTHPLHETMRFQRLGKLDPGHHYIAPPSRKFR